MPGTSCPAAAPKCPVHLASVMLHVGWRRGLGAAVSNVLLVFKPGEGFPFPSPPGQAQCQGLGRGRSQSASLAYQFYHDTRP